MSKLMTVGLCSVHLRAAQRLDINFHTIDPRGNLAMA